MKRQLVTVALAHASIEPARTAEGVIEPGFYARRRHRVAVRIFP